MKIYKKITTVSVVTGFVFSFLFLLEASAQENSAHVQHDHEHNQLSLPELSLDHGKKWKTDAPLRQGMLSINEEVKQAKKLFHSGLLSENDAKKLARHINDQVQYLIKNCKLPPQADITLHVFIGDLLTAANHLSEDPLSNQGLPVIVKTLELYTLYFDHPEIL